MIRVSSWGEFFLYILIGVLVCAVLGVIIYFAAKKENANTSQLLEKIPDELKEKLASREYKALDAKGVKYSTEGLVADIQNKGEKSKLILLFFNTPRMEFYPQTAKIATSDVEAKGIKVLDFIPCEMKYDKEYQVHSFKKLM